MHFDEVAYPDECGEIAQRIRQEADILSRICGVEITTVSMHRPSKATLEADAQIPGIINSYGKTFFHEFKYLSDSRCHWREPVLDIVRSGEFDRLHILTHAFWYHEESMSISEALREFISAANQTRYKMLAENIYCVQFASIPDFLIRMQAAKFVPHTDMGKFPSQQI